MKLRPIVHDFLFVWLNKRLNKMVDSTLGYPTDDQFRLLRLPYCYCCYYWFCCYCLFRSGIVWICIGDSGTKFSPVLPLSLTTEPILRDRAQTRIAAVENVSQVQAPAFAKTALVASVCNAPFHFYAIHCETMTLLDDLMNL